MNIKTKFGLNEEVLLKDPEEYTSMIKLTSKLIIKGILLDDVMNVQYVLNIDSLKSIIVSEKELIKGHIIKRTLVNFA